MNSKVLVHRPLSPRTRCVRACLQVTYAFAFLLGLIGSNSAFAAAPSANTVIGNQAAATYLDTSGVQRSVTSNWVQTTVSQVGAFHLSNDNTKVGVAGAHFPDPG